MRFNKAQTSTGLSGDTRDTVSTTLIHRDQCHVPRNTVLGDDADILNKFALGSNKFTRWIIQLNMIHASNPLTQKYFRSETAVNCEKVRHIKLNYWYIVHPLTFISKYGS
ncbi:unnamed protein product [Callosobruchus maculatus]|uniref:Uncharacterized protein n=1 Tax=Callosobruchus maculatus TaxID=64391 RepID=A0A653DT74_CALMS|nr:unnamed protein product [Callosobruchus maculatus]